MTGQGCMLLTGKRALEFSGSVAAPTNNGIGGLEEIMGPNGEAQYAAADLKEAYDILFRHYDFTYIPKGSSYVPLVNTEDPLHRATLRYGSAYLLEPVLRRSGRQKPPGPMQYMKEFGKRVSLVQQNSSQTREAEMRL